MSSQSLLNRRRRSKQPPVRFVDVSAPPPSDQEDHHALQQDLPQLTPENPHSYSETDESGTDPEEFDEVITVSLSELRNNVQCPICLGIIKNARTVMECLHRFCKECIDKSMRLGNNECPVCRIHCASRRSLRDDPNFDALVGSVYTDVDKYEEKELVLHEEERAHNEQIQSSIAQIYERQSEALIKVQKTSKDIVSSTSRVSRPRRNSYSKRMNNQNIKFNQDAEVIEGIQSANSESEPTNENIKSPPGPVIPCLLTWGKGVAKRNPRHMSGLNSSKTTRINRIQKLANHLAVTEKNDHERDSVITPHMEGDKMLWTKDQTISGSNPCSSMTFLQAPPEAIKKFDEECTFIALAQKMNSILKNNAP